MITNGNGTGDRRLMCRGVRGATTVTQDEAEEIVTAVRELLQQIVWANNMQPDEIASVYFTTTVDLTAVYPAVAARQMGWQDIALLYSQEVPVPDGLPRCIRVLIHWNTDRPANEITHVYLKEASALRPDRPQARPLVRPRQIDPMQAMIRVLETQI